MSRPAKSLWYNLGAMFGNIAAGMSADPKNPPARLAGDADAVRDLVNQRVQEVTIDTPSGPVTLRRTITDEVERARAAAPIAPVPPHPPTTPNPPPASSCSAAQRP